MKNTLIVTHGGTDEDAQKHLKMELGVKEEAIAELVGETREGFYFRVYPEDTNGKFDCSFIWLKDPKNHDTILHEVIHLVMRNFDDRGVAIRVENDEILAYYITYWFRTLKTMMRHI